MAGTGNKVKFHGAFGSKADAVRKERSTPGAFIEKRHMRGGVRYVVMTRRK